MAGCYAAQGSLLRGTGQAVTRHKAVCDLPTLPEKFMLYTELPSKVVDNHVHAYHLVNKVYYHRPVI